jgi:transcriptional regulator with XRE-family HTH domain
VEKLKHWTNRNDDTFAHAIASDFVAQIETVMEDGGMERKALAEKIGVTPGRVSQVLNNPASMNLRTVVRYSRAVNRKVAIVTYDDGDKDNENGPIDAGVFSGSWEQAGRPTSLFDLGGASLTSSHGFVLFVQGSYPAHSLKRIPASREIERYQDLFPQIGQTLEQPTIVITPKFQKKVIYAENSQKQIQP